MEALRNLLGIRGRHAVHLLFFALIWICGTHAAAGREYEGPAPGARIPVRRKWPDGSPLPDYSEARPSRPGRRRGPRHTSPLDVGQFTASVPLHHLRDSQYVAEIGIGTPPQPVHALFDTGSANMWVVDERCPDASCDRVRRFSPRKSTTFRESRNPKALDIKFGTGSIHGITGEDTITVGTLRVANQSFGLVEREFGDWEALANIFDDIYFEALFGLSFPVMSATGPSILDALFDQNSLPRHVVSFYLSNSTKPDAPGSPSSSLYFGGVDSSRFVPPLQFARVKREHYWEVGLDSLHVGTTKVCCDEGPASVVFDSGTSFNTVPSEAYQQFMNLMPSDDTCDDSRFPNITYVLEGGVTIELTPDMYVLPGDGGCSPAVMLLDVPQGPAYVLGTLPFMRHHFTVFDRGHGPDEAVVGIARARHL